MATSAEDTVGWAKQIVTLGKQVQASTSATDAAAKVRQIDKLVAQEPYFTVITIPAGTYKTQTHTVKSFGARVAAVTSEEVPEDMAYAVVKAVFENLDSFKRLHPGLGHLQAKDMMKNGVTAPLHPGAARYFRQAGMM